MKEQLINDVLQFLIGKLPEEYTMELRMYMYYQLSEYDVSKRCTEIAVLPEKTYMDDLNFYIDSLRLAGRSERTLENYRMQLGMMLHSINKPCGEITTDDLYTYLAVYQRQRQVGNRYLDGKRVVFNGFFGWLQRKRRIVYNPASGLDRIKYEKRIKKPFTDEEREKLRCACKYQRDLAIILQVELIIRGLQVVQITLEALRPTTTCHRIWQCICGYALPK